MRRGVEIDAIRFGIGVPSRTIANPNIIMIHLIENELHHSLFVELLNLDQEGAKTLIIGALQTTCYTTILHPISKTWKTKPKPLARSSCMLKYAELPEGT